MSPRMRTIYSNPQQFSFMGNYLNFIYLFYIVFNSQGHIVMGSLWVEETVHTTWPRFCTVNHWALASNYQLSNMKCPGQDSNRRPHRLKASTLTATPPGSRHMSGMIAHPTYIKSAVQQHVDMLSNVFEPLFYNHQIV